MPEYLKALIVILTLSGLTFGLAKKPACTIITQVEFNRWRNAWLSITIIVFLAHNIWLYFLLAALYILSSAPSESNRSAFFFILLLALPQASSTVPGFGIINQLIEVDSVRFLSLIILLPGYLALSAGSRNSTFGQSLAEKTLFLYLVLIVLLTLRGTTLTDTVREGFYTFIEIFVPYYVVSRSIRKEHDFHGALLAFVLASFALASIGFFEFTRHWLLYVPLDYVLEGNKHADFTSYLVRDGGTRAIATTGQPIVLGYVMVVAFGFYLFLKEKVLGKLKRNLGMGLLMVGIISPLSRGPWLGAYLLLVVFFATGKYALRRLALLGLATLLGLSALAFLPGGQRVLNLLPFIGTTEKVNVEYREQLIDKATIVIQRYPWFGLYGYRNTPELQSLKQGQGIVDVVNTYIRVALESGLVGLSLFAGFFLLTLAGVYRSLQLISDRNSDLYLLGRVLIATLSAILLIITTVSSISVIPVVYWSVAGLCAAYCRMVKIEFAIR